MCTRGSFLRAMWQWRFVVHMKCIAQIVTWMKEKVAAPVETFPDSCEVSAAVWLQSKA